MQECEIMLKVKVGCFCEWRNLCTILMSLALSLPCSYNNHIDLDLDSTVSLGHIKYFLTDLAETSNSVVEAWLAMKNVYAGKGVRDPYGKYIFQMI